MSRDEIALPDGTTVVFDDEGSNPWVPSDEEGSNGTLHRYRHGEHIDSFPLHYDPKREPYPDWVQAWIAASLPSDPDRIARMDAAMDAFDALSLAERKRMVLLRELGEFGEEFADDV